MDTETGARPSTAQRWFAVLALASGAAAVVVLLVCAGPRSIALLGLGVAGLAVAAAGVWWALTRRGLLRVLAGTLAAVAPIVVLLLYVWAGLLWVVLVSLGLWTLAVSAGGAALSKEPRRARLPGVRTAPPEHPFLIMNPRSGGGKVGRFRLRERAEELGAEVHLLDPAHHEDVVALARGAVDDGADLLGVAGGDGTQAMVAAVAAEHGIPFMVISAGTRNHFALDLGLDRDDPSSCLDALTDGVELRVDLGSINGRAFVNNASFGTYASVVQSPAYRNDKVHTTLEMLPDLLTHQRGPRLTVRVAGTAIEGPQAVLVSNNPYRMGDPAGLGRREELDSGVLGVLGITVDNAAQAAGILAGRHGPGLTVLTAHEVVVDADEPEIQAGVDGEALTLPTPVHCTIRPRALRVRVPRRRPGVPRAKPPMDWRRLRRLVWAKERLATGGEAGR
ncbi:diacylglycerol/lipid kinase family protein [Streptomyces gilvosporeus]|uniref:Diacylglycerol kinase n=1 Tax=Streptomyces gilvosporeus TaxID=553510 RepID=A0A1V0TLE6_9ACTN|nr:diacylglycerol kinase family protein [Streptomyces gilvosporeus]ARF53747.1 diacylglycerol kinase [Streptomyces gilvosporeus]